VLRVITQNTPTTFYYGATERYGIEYELARAFADHIGVRLELTTAEQLGDIYPALENGDAHIGAAGLLQSELFRDEIVFGPGYQSVSANVIYRMGEKRPDSLQELAGSSLEVRAGSSYAYLLRDTARDLPELGFAENPSASAETLMRRVADGTVDFAIVKSNEFNLLRHYYPEIQVAFELPASAELAWALPREAAGLQEAVGEFFAGIRATGELDAILDRYYDAAPDFDFVGARAFVRHLNQRFPDYQTSFEAAERETGIDWRLLAAIAYQESHWDADAVSPTGVEGLMMLTAKTAQIVGVKDRSDPHQSIMGGAR
jgi:membrane-bound lytic murein transglycosylase MltF